MLYKLRITCLLIFVLVVSSCAGPNTQICHPINSLSCLSATEVWGKSINKVVAANFQDELGFYKPVVHKAKFSNAWVDTGG